MKRELGATDAGSMYFAHVDGLRALAVLAVLLYHLSPGLLPGGFIGVDVFFVISGYVVTAALAGHRSEHAGAFLGLFYARRLARLVPAAVIMLIVATTLYVLFVPRTWFNRAAETVGQAAFWGFSNWTLDRHVANYFEPGVEFNPFTHTWSLGVEEQFYVVVPILLFMALSSNFSAQRRGLATAVIAALAALSFVACYYVGLSRVSHAVFYQLTFRFWELAAGVLLYLLGRRVVVGTPTALGFYGMTGWFGLVLVLTAMGMPRPEVYPFIRSTVGVVGALLLIGLPFVARHDFLAVVLSSRVALWVGRRSYALYLWHWPIYVLARWTTGLNIWPFNLLVVVLSFTAAAVSYVAVENPVRQNVTLKRWRLAGRIGTFLIVLCAGWSGGRALLANQPRLGLGQPTRQAPDWYANHNLLKTTLASTRQCEPTERQVAVGGEPDRMTIFLPDGCPEVRRVKLFVLGDSHATAYMSMLEQLSAEQGRTVTVVQVPGCGYASLMRPLYATPDERCYRLAQAAMRAVLQRSSPGDIVFLPSLRLPRLIEAEGDRRLPIGTPTSPAGDVYARTVKELDSTRQATQDVPRWITPFLEVGMRVVFELPKPILRAHPFQCVDWFNRNNPACADGLSELRADQERYRAPVVDAIRQLAATYPGVSFWDPLPPLCHPERCNAMEGNRPLFFDADHVSPYGNMVLFSHFRSEIDALSGP